MWQHGPLCNTKDRKYGVFGSASSRAATELDGHPSYWLLLEERNHESISISRNEHLALYIFLTLLTSSDIMKFISITLVPLQIIRFHQ